ncbi:MULTISPECIES: hypothetical protein [unclassified Microcoleus]|uniref:hypothetical protein n=1 Tax=unclassified Microcoleus TaxID=2642155 RepID=UPI002FCF1F85
MTVAIKFDRALKPIDQPQMNILPDLKLHSSPLICDSTHILHHSRLTGFSACSTKSEFSRFTGPKACS